MYYSDGCVLSLTQLPGQISRQESVVQCAQRINDNRRQSRAEKEEERNREEKRELLIKSAAHLST